MKQTQIEQHILLDKSGTPFNRYFTEGIGSCHAYLTLREDWRDHARLIQQEIGFRSVRCHGIFHDLVGIYQMPWGEGEVRYNFQNLDKIYDFWLSIGLKPYIELAFMPAGLASGPETVFQYRANVTMPKDMDAWSSLIRAFVSHIIDRYGISEVVTWYFEVWNEPDLKPWFFTGDQADYFKLYASTARAIKAVDPRLRVGGPATSANKWVQDMLDFCAAQNVPIDFLSTHHYCADAALVLGTADWRVQWRGQKAMQSDVAKTRATVRASRFPEIEVHYTEWNVSPIHEDRFGKDSEFTGAFVCQTIRDVSGLAERYMLWAISDIFEESGPGETPFSGKYGLVNMHGIKKPVYHAFRFMARMYDEMIESNDSSFVTRAASGDLRVLSWNFCEVAQENFNGGDYALHDAEKDEAIRLTPCSGRVRVRAWRVDREHGSALRAWQAMDSPQYLTAAQVEALKAAAEPELCRDEVIDCDGELVLRHVLPPSGMIYYEVEKV